MSTFFQELTLLEGRYAKALYDDVREREKSDQKVSHTLKHIIKEGKAFISLLKENADLDAALMTPLVPHIIQAKILSRLLEKINPTSEFKNFISLIMRHGRLHYFTKILDVIEKIFMDDNHIIPAKITAAKPLEGSVLKGITEYLARSYGDNLQITVLIDPALVSGYRIEIPGKIFDASLQRQLHLIQNNTLNLTPLGL